MLFIKENIFILPCLFFSSQFVWILSL